MTEWVLGRVVGCANAKPHMALWYGQMSSKEGLKGEQGKFICQLSSQITGGQLIFFFFRFYLFIHERHRDRGRDIGHRQREKPDAGLDPKTLGSWPEPPRRPVPQILAHKKFQFLAVLHIYSLSSDTCNAISLFVSEASQIPAVFTTVAHGSLGTSYNS